MLKRKRRDALLVIGSVISIGIIGCSHEVTPLSGNSTEIQQEKVGEVDPKMARYVALGYHSLSGAWAGNCIIDVQASKNPGYFLKRSEYRLLETTEDIRSYVKSSLSAGANGPDSGFTVNANITNTFEKTVHFNSNTVAIGVLYEFNACIANFDSGVFNSKAIEDITTQNKKDFEFYYGNSFVKQAYLGGAMMIFFTSETTTDSQTTKSQIRTALNIKYKQLFGGNVTKEDSLSMESTLKKAHIEGKIISTAGNVGLSDIICSKERIDAAVTEFSNYYNNALNGVDGYSLNVYKTQLVAYNKLNSNAYSITQFPDYYDPAEFSSGILTASNICDETNPLILNDRTHVKLTWQDICTFEDGYRIYCQKSFMTPTLVATTLANARTAQITIPDLGTSVEEAQFWVVPFKNGIEGRFNNSASLSNYRGNTLQSTINAHEIETLRPNEYLLSNNGKYKLIMQSDGNLCLYNMNWWKPGLKSVWHTGTWKTPGGYAQMSWGALYLRYPYPKGDPTFYWRTGRGSGGAKCKLVLQDDGNLVIYNSANNLVWQTNTAGK